MLGVMRRRAQRGGQGGALGAEVTLQGGATERGAFREERGNQREGKSEKGGGEEEYPPVFSPGCQSGTEESHLSGSGAGRGEVGMR